MSEVEIYPGRFSPLGLGTIPHAEIQDYTGLELLQRIIDGIYPAPPISFQLNFALAEVSEGRAVFRGVPNERHLNPMGGVHGGWAATLLDSALACSVQTLLEKGEAYTTAEFKVNLTRPITPRTGEVVAEGKVIHKGRTLAVSEATLKDANGKLLAFGTETCSIFPAVRLAAR
ncbi:MULTISPECIES: PaaI family thioesterase [unclassified Mesorhizobium]|uniref:PaaI family thioesterase n=1 Tax=unclassified Mesorhizobium TaxID=325217 RepID=UPI000869C1F2|nr:MULTISPECIES: PaaI family thioesterase [unclassified Mesorhizobium]MBN9256528.1 PaaI family thioesterase [Mesorhizobium sp.]MBN9275409.1 PaaI family thioesterase [Mesorhizobium sp.]ODT20405.1 MAG: phenylacetic acid degradation protein [Mesorhizobium sp. SCN 65-12]OJX83175.1 MAG: phenylacetic acid degradation protein [Mesorhizobium sp. 65-26]